MNHDVCAVSSEVLVDRVVDDLPHQVVKGVSAARVAKEHPRSFSDSLQPFQLSDRTLAVRLGLLLCFAFLGHRISLTV